MNVCRCRKRGARYRKEAFSRGSAVLLFDAQKILKGDRLASFHFVANVCPTKVFKITTIRKLCISSKNEGELLCLSRMITFKIGLSYFLFQVDGLLSVVF